MYSNYFFSRHMYTHKIFRQIYTDTNKGVQNVLTNAERLKRFHSLHGNQVLLGGSI